MNLMKALTEIQRGTLDFIVSYVRDHGFPPTIREIADSCGGVQVQAAVDRLRALERKGYISRVMGSPRTIRVLEAVA